MPKIKSLEQKISHVWSVLCTSSSIDSQSNNITLFNVIEQLEVTRSKEALPIDKEKGDVLPIQMELVSLWKKNGLGKEVGGEAMMILIDPHGRELGKNIHPIKITDVQKRLRTRIQIQGIKVTVSGNYFWRIVLKMGDFEEIVSEIPLEIKINL